MTLFERIQFAAEKQKKSVIKVAEEAGLSEKAIYRYKQGVTPRKSTLLAIARAIPTSVEFLQGKTDDWKVPDSQNEQELGLDKDDEEMLALFRKSTEGMTEDEKEKFKRSFVKLLKVAKDLNS
ncbi:helix-turn-helix domain-containing protein [Lactobacillus gasseri]|uniref:helix-turn-helix domain-containing protein n=1 Tax=Lactobacillus gasseri TaxID=1596 RepID=UPI000DEA81E8|nr:helix-turn-helix domain-containing protein [Lactobacillus gasseri]MCZ3947231.1 helix-turn-helix domain-containing protein [Lactobacillus gasseri]RBQ00701.1 hypothetical protein C3745_07210 [Lactobacillus gasseri]